VNLLFRETVFPGDPQSIREIVSGTGFFNEEEIAIAGELAQDALDNPASDYRFVIAESEGRLVGYSCYGRIGGTVNAYDFYWIAVRDELRGRGIGRRILDETVRRIALAGGGRLYAETSSRDLYSPTRKFYLDNDFFEEARIAAFYAPDDAKVIYTRVIPAAPSR
jgi:GNAT superfamily N-acetyltransferase